MKTERKIRSEHRELAAKLYTEAFYGKFCKILDSQEIMQRLLEQFINEDRAVTVVSPDGNLLGVAGYKRGGKPMINIKSSLYRNEYGIIKGTIKYLLTLLFYLKHASKNQLVMDGITVHEKFRSKGLGRMLFRELEALAKEFNYDSIKLEVVDENPRARKLYEKIGFKEVKYQKLRFLKKITNVSGISTMVKHLN